MPPGDRFYSERLTAAVFARDLGVWPRIERFASFRPTGFPQAKLLSCPVEWNFRLRRTSGQAFYAPCLKIELHPNIKQVPSTWDGLPALACTFLHEFAHIAAHLEYGQSAWGHGDAWWEMMHQLGRRPKRCHQYGHLGQAPKVELSLDDI